MKIVFISNYFWNIYNFRLDLITTLIKLNHKVICVSQGDIYLTKLEDLGVECYQINLNPKGTNPILDLVLLFNYYRLFNRIKPDVVLTYTIKPNIYGNLAAKLQNIPTVSNITGLGTLFIKQNIYTSIAKFLYKLSLSSTYHVFFQNNDDKFLFTKNKLIKKQIASVVPGSGVNINKFNYERKHNKADKFLFVGRLLFDKGVIEYLNAAVNILDKYPKKEFLLVGEIGYKNNTSISKEILYKYTNNYSQIKYLGKTDNILAKLKSVDVVVLPSYREGLSKSIIEASAMKLPVVTTNVPGCRDIIEHNYNGFLCDVKSIKSLENAMLKMINLNEKERLLMGDLGRKKIINKFSSVLVSKIYVDKINELSNKFI